MLMKLKFSKGKLQMRNSVPYVNKCHQHTIRMSAESHCQNRSGTVFHSTAHVDGDLMANIMPLQEQADNTTTQKYLTYKNKEKTVFQALRLKFNELTQLV